MTGDAIIVGTGVIGKTIAYTLARSGMRVTCVGTGSFTPGTASTAAGAMLGVLGEVTVSARSAVDQEELQLRAAAARLFPGFLAELSEVGKQAIQLGHGSFIVGNLVNESDAGNLTAIRQAARVLNLRCESADPLSVPGLRPARGHEPVGTLYLADEGFLDSWRLMEALDNALDALAVAVEVAAVTAVAVQHGRATGVHLYDGRVLHAQNIVLANGVGVQALLDGLCELPGRLPRLLPGKGVSMLAADVDDHFPHVIRTPNRDFACGSHVVPRANGNVYLGATNRVSATPGDHAAVTPGEVHALLHSVMHEINVRIRTASLVSTRYGLRPLTSDRYPLIGETELAGLWLATGTYRNGILLSPAIANILAAEIRGETPAVRNSFSPAAEFRRNSEKHDTDEVLTEGLRHLASFILEPGGHLPYDRYRELRAFMTGLAFLALSDDAENEFKRVEIQKILSKYPIPEVVPQLYYWLALGGDNHHAEDLPVKW